MEIFLNVPGYGNMYICDVLLSFVYPRAFICKDELLNRYMFYEMEQSNNRYVYLVCKLSKADYFLVTRRKKSIPEVYRESKPDDVFALENLDIDYGLNEVHILPSETKKYISELPKGDIFAENVKHIN